jgi:alpha-galactosidase
MPQATTTEQSGSWRIGNGLIELVTDGLQTRSIGDWQGAGPAWQLAWNGAIRTATSVERIETSRDSTSVTLSIRTRVDDALLVTQNLQCWHDLAVIEQWLEIEALESGVLRDVTPWRIGIAAPQTLTMHTIAGVQQQGGWSGNPGDFRSFRREERLLDHPVTLLSDVRSTWYEMPWAALSLGERGLFTGLRYSGRWRTDAEPGAAISIRADFLETTLAAGERWVSPRVFTGVFTGDLDAAGRVMHEYQRQVLSPKLPADFPWVQYNTWFSYLTEISAERLKPEVEIAAELGMDLFYIDAGWWTGNVPNDWHFSSGLGNWRENRDKFPDGIAAFADFVRSKGLKFGIWVEPERVDLRTATTATWREEWLVRHHGNYNGPDWPQDTEAAWLCFGCQETQDWAIDWISRLVEELDVRWLKWDSNWWAVCTATDHGHGAGDGEAAQLAGVYRVMDALRDRFPELIIENCAGGGTRMDFEMAAHSHVAWVSDATEPAARVRFQGEGANYLFVPATMNAWVSESKFENLNGRDIPEVALNAIVRSRMIGALGFSGRMSEWGEPTKAILRERIAEYKTFRHLLKDGYTAHLLPQHALDNPKFPSPHVWGADLFYAADRGEAVLLAFRNRSAESTITFHLPQLDPAASYRISGDGVEPGTRSGAELAETGITVQTPVLGSALARFERV